jgi:hypothetical protein
MEDTLPICLVIIYLSIPHKNYYHNEKISFEQSQKQYNWVLSIIF